MRSKVLMTSALLLAVAAPAAAQDTTGTMRVWRLVPQGEAYISGDCVELQEGTQQFHPSGQDTPSQQGGPGACPPGMAPADDLTTGSTSDEQDSVTGDQDDASGSPDETDDTGGADETDTGGAGETDDAGGAATE